MILGQGRTPLLAESFQVGSVSLSMRFFGDGRLSEAAFRAAQIAAGAELEEALQPFAPQRWGEALGSSGTVGAVSQLLAANHVTDGRITPAGLRWCIAGCIDAGHTDKLRWPALRPDRRAVLPGGLAILYTLATHFGIDSLIAARGALRQGVIIDLRERLEALRHAHPEDVRDETVRELQGRFGVAADQALRVRTLAQTLYDTVADGDAHAENRRELGWACDLHEVGQMVSHHDHHRHSAYLVANVDRAGFSQSQQRRVSDLVLGQRGGLRKLEPALDNPAFAWQALCLRLAVIKCHARGAVDFKALQLQRDGGTALLHFTPAWAESHPRTLHLLGEEAEAWARQGGLRLVMPGPA
jgi:exopolyphosphatase / guanosine-5'-triphosphate,3'-diphosphate pyrophosphatase